MARHRFSGIFTDGYGNVKESASVVVTLSGTSTVANLYLTSTGGAAVTSVTTASDGSFFFYVDDTEYSTDQEFDVTLSLTGFTTKSYTEMVLMHHARSHDIISSSDHTSSATSGQILQADANGLPVDATNTDAEVASAVSLSHTQNTDSGTTGNTFTVDSDSTTGKIIVDVALGAADKSLTITNDALTDNRVVTFQNVTGTVALTSDLHTQSHAITSTSDHTSTATSGQMLKADANGLPIDATNTDTDVASAVSLKHSNASDHTQNTDSGTTGNTFTIDSDSTTGKIIIDVALDAADKSLTLTNAALTDNRVATFQNKTGTVALTSDIAAASYASAAEQLAGAEDAKGSTPSVSREMILNLKPVVNGDVNKLDIFSKSGGAAPDATNPIKVMIPDGNGYTQRSRAAAVASGTGQIVLADAANYWSKGSLDAEIKTAYLYAIWSTADAGIVWALAGYAGFTRVPAAGGAATDDDWFLLEGSSSYTAVITDYCVCVAKIRYQYDTADTPDHTIQATVLDAPQVIWNPKSDYAGSASLATTNTSGSDIAGYSAASVVVKQSGRYLISGKASGLCTGAYVQVDANIRTGSSTYASATVKENSGVDVATASYRAIAPLAEKPVYLNAGDTIHLGVAIAGPSGNRSAVGDNGSLGSTFFSFKRID